MVPNLFFTGWLFVASAFTDGGLHYYTLKNPAKKITAVWVTTQPHPHWQEDMSYWVRGLPLACSEHFPGVQGGALLCEGGNDGTPERAAWRKLP